MAAPVRILYFAQLRERAGRAGETVALPPGVATVGALVDWLRARGGREAEAFAEKRIVRAAVNQTFARANSPVAPGDEVAFFPPVTGG